jgi:cytochrome c-type biogenesis protein CcmF
MAGYDVTFTHDTLETYTRTFTVHFSKKDESGAELESFDLFPNVLYDKSFTKIAASNPATRRYWNRDVFTHIASLPAIEMDLTQRRSKEDSLDYRPLTLSIGKPVRFVDTVRLDQPDTVLLKTYTLTVESVTRNPVAHDYRPEPGDLALGAKIRIERDDEEGSFTAEPALVLRNDRVYAYPAQINPLSSRIRLGDAFLTQTLEAEQQLNYQDQQLRAGESFQISGHTVRFLGFEKKPSNPGYSPVEGDLPIGAKVEIQASNGETYPAEPVFVIRGNQAFDIKSNIEELGLHLRFSLLDPKTEMITLKAAMSSQKEQSVPIDLATDSLRSDYIVLEAIEFPGINFFWVGASLMMLGLLLGMFYRLSSKRAAVVGA